MASRGRSGSLHPVPATSTSPNITAARLRDTAGARGGLSFRFSHNQRLAGGAPQSSLYAHQLSPGALVTFTECPLGSPTLSCLFMLDFADNASDVLPAFQTRPQWLS